MKKIYILATILLALLLSACGGGSGGTSEGGGSNQVNVIDCNNSNSASATNDCGNAGVPDYYTCIKDSDSLVKQSNNTTVQIISNATTKKVCVQTGAAHILR